VGSDAVDELGQNLEGVIGVKVEEHDGAGVEAAEDIMLDVRGGDAAPILTVDGPMDDLLAQLLGDAAGSRVEFAVGRPEVMGAEAVVELGVELGHGEAAEVFVLHTVAAHQVAGGADLVD
jgi:hypothetical protein